MPSFMKDSGVSWIGQIPEHWDVVRTKNCYTNKKQVVGENADSYERLALTLNGVIKRPKDDSTGLQPEAFSGYQILRENELVFKLIDLENVATSRVGYSYYTGIVSPAYIVLHPRKDNESKFGEYYFLSMWQREIFNHIGDDGVRSSLNSGDLLNIPYLDIPDIEKEKIVSHLDKICAEIDAVITKTKATIEEYKKLKQSIITEAVFKGVRGNRLMKDSGIEWIGDIPIEWNRNSIKNIATTCSGGTPSSDDETLYDGDINWICSYDLKEKPIFESGRKITQKGADSIAGKMQSVGSILIAMYGGSGTIGNSGILECESRTNQAICSVKFNNNYVLDYYGFYYILAIRKYWMIYAVGTRKDPNISQDVVKRMPCIIPPLEEQEEIIEFISQKCAEMDTLIAQKIALLEEMESYKKSVIYEYVTGKKEVI